MKVSGRRPALALAAVGAAAIAAAAIAGRGRIAEEWWIYRLGSRDDATRVAAAERLAERKSLRAVPALIRAIEADPREDVSRLGGVGISFIHLTPVAFALYQMGPEALPLVEKQDQALYPVRDEHLVSILETILHVWRTEQARASRSAVIKGEYGSLPGLKTTSPPAPAR